jgi:hypothetical protein
MIHNMSDASATRDISTPLIYSRAGEPARLGVRARALASLIGVAGVVVLAIAVVLDPKPDGVGTHSRLGFAGCQFLDRTGLPCPSCGMTTSFAWFVRGNLLASIYIQPMGAVLALLTACSAVGSFYIATTGQPSYRLLSLFPPGYYLFPLFGLAVAAWGWKMFLRLKGLDGW